MQPKHSIGFYFSMLILEGDKENSYMLEMTNEVCEGVKLVMEERVILMGTRNGGISSTDKGQLWVGT